MKGVHMVAALIQFGLSHPAVRISLYDTLVRQAKSIPITHQRT